MKVEPPAAEGRPYPNLATVPIPKREAPEVAEERQRELAELSRTRDAALADDRALRDQGRFPNAPTTSAAAPETSQPRQAPQPSPSRPAASTPPMPAPSPVPQPSAPAPSSLPVMAQAAPPVSAPPAAIASSQRVGTVSFLANGAALPAASQALLRNAAAQAQSRPPGRVRLMPAQMGRGTVMREFTRARIDAMTQVIAAAGLPAARVTVGDDLGRRVDVYDVYVEF
jgi:hypothetical protein